MKRSIYHQNYLFWKHFFVLIFISFCKHSFCQSFKVDSLNKIYKTTSSDQQKALALYETAKYFSFSKPDTAIGIARKGLELSEKINFDKGILVNSFELGHSYKNTGQEFIAVEFFQKSLKMATAKDLLWFKAKSIYYLGIIDEHALNYKSAEKKFLESLSLFELLNDHYETANTYNTLGSFYENHNRLDKGLAFYIKSFSLAKQKKDSATLGIVALNMSNIFLRQNKISEALNYNTQGYKTAVQIKDKYLEVSCLIEFAKIYLKSQDLRKSEEYINKVLLLFANEKNIYIKEEIGNAYFIMAKINEGFLNYKEALLFHEKGDQLMDSINRLRQTEKVFQLQTAFEEQQKNNRILLLEESRKERLQRIFVLSIFSTVLLIGILILIKYNYYRKRLNRVLNQKNIFLSEKNKEIQSQNEEIQSQNEEINTQSDDLQLKSEMLSAALEEIKYHNSVLDERVKIRTMDLEKQNQKLREYSFINSHKLRSPLASIMGMVNIFRILGEKNIDQEMINHLDNAAQQLDRVVHEIQETLKSNKNA